jgi:hypothetical protein
MPKFAQGIKRMDMLDEVLRILTLYDEQNFFATPRVPRDMEHYARAALDIPDDEYVLAMMRHSFKKFHRGIIFGRDGIYWMNGVNVETSCNHLTWKQMSAQKAQFRALSNKVVLGEGAVFDNSGSITSGRTIINLFDVLIERYEQQATERDGFIFDETQAQALNRTIPLNKEELKADNAKSAAATVSPIIFILNSLKALGQKVSSVLTKS